MFNQLKNLVNQIFDSGNKAIDNLRNPQIHKENPVQQQALQSSFQNYATSKPAAFITESANRLKKEYQPDPTGSRISFQPPFQEQMRQTSSPEYIQLGESFKSFLNKGGKVGNTILDWTLRPIITRPIAQAVMTGADAATSLLHKVDPRMPEHMPSVTATDPAGRLLFGDQPMNSYTGQARTGTNWLEGIGVPKNAAVPLGIAAGTISAGLDSTGVGGLGKSAAKETAEKAIVNNFDTIAEAAWKAKGSKGRLSALMNYGDELLTRGFKREEVDKLGAKVGSWIIDNNITPKQWAEKSAAKASEFAHINNFVDKFKEFVGGRQSASWQGLIKSQEFKKLDQMPLEQLASAIESGKLDIAPLRQYFDDALKRLNDAGIKTNKVENYLPHLYNASADQVEATIGRKLSRGSKFSLSRYFQDYAEAKSYGLTAKYSKISDVIKEYESSITKSIEDKKMFDYLRDNKFFMTKSEIDKLPKEKRLLTSDWIPVDPKVVGGEFKSDTVFYAPTEVREALERFLQSPNDANRINGFQQFLNSASGWNQRIKNLILTGGVPTTSLNSYGYIMHKRFMLSAKNPITDAALGYKWMINSNSAEKFVANSMKDAADAVSHGLTLDAPDLKPYVKEAISDKGLLSSIKNKWGNFNQFIDDIFAGPTFKKFIPAAKLYRWKQDVQILTDTGVDLKTAKRTAAEVVNEQMAGKNYDMLLKDKSWNSALRTVLLAPSYLESSIDTAKGMANVLLDPKNPKSVLYKTYARNMILNRLLREFTNLGITGHLMIQNEAGHKGEIETPFYDSMGKKVYLKNSGQDYENLPLNVADYTLNGDPLAAGKTLYSKTSPLVNLAVGLGVGVDYKGNKIANSWDSGPEKLGKYASWGSGYVLPPQVREVGDAATGKQSPEQATAKILELPLTFAGGATSQKEKEQLQLMRQGGMSNQEAGIRINNNKAYNQPTDLTEEQQLKNLREGLPIDTQRNWLGKPKSGSGGTSNSQSSTEAMGGTYSVKNELQAQKIQSDKKATVKKIYQNLDTDEQIKKTLSANGISEKEALYMMAEDLGVENGQRSEFIIDTLKQSKSEDEFKATALELAKAGLLTTGVTKQMLDAGKITSEQKKYFDDIISTSKGKSIASGTKAKSLPASVKMNAPTMRLPSIKAPPKLGSLSATSKPFTTPKLGSVAKLPTLADMKEALKAKNMKVEFSQLPQAPGR